MALAAQMQQDEYDREEHYRRSERQHRVPTGQQQESVASPAPPPSGLTGQIRANESLPSSSQPPKVSAAAMTNDKSSKTKVKGSKDKQKCIIC